jgi:hypothetical protein
MSDLALTPIDIKGFLHHVLSGERLLALRGLEIRVRVRVRV